MNAMLRMIDKRGKLVTLAVSALLLAVAPLAYATDDLPGVNLVNPSSDDAPSAPAVQPEFQKKSRVAPVLDQSGIIPDQIFGPDGKPINQLSAPGTEVPSSGTMLYDRMGIKLPDLPPERPFAGKIDEAYGAYQRGFYVTALDLALPRAQLGDPAAQTLIAELVSQGRGVKRDLKKAVFWYSKAAEGGDASAMFKYALILMEGRLVPQDKKKADELMHKSADAGNALAQFNWAQILVSEKPGNEGLKNALPYYEKSAEKGIADSEYALSQIYLNLPGIPEAKRKSAKDWLLKAATAGFDTAQFDMAVWLVNGIEFKRNYTEGFNWMRRAAVGGNVAAQNKLAHLYRQAIGTRPDPIEAAKWYVLSRRAGLQDATLDDFYQGLTDQQQKQAIQAANAQQQLMARR
jgi:uncharacterized protein